jgi:hypothetical protein
LSIPYLKGLGPEVFRFIHSVLDYTGVWTQGFTLAKQAFYDLSHTSSPFCSGYFRDGISQSICPGWPWTFIFHPPISASQVARITTWWRKPPVPASHFFL